MTAFPFAPLQHGCGLRRRHRRGDVGLQLLGAVRGENAAAGGGADCAVVVGMGRPDEFVDFFGRFREQDLGAGGEEVSTPRCRSLIMAVPHAASSRSRFPFIVIVPFITA